MPEPDLLQRLATRLAGDRAIDWDAEERAAVTDEERGAIRQLRLLAAMAGFHRLEQAGDVGEDLAASISSATGVTESGLPEPEFPPGSSWAHLEILGKVGAGAFGTVYRARDTRLDRIVALKIERRAVPAPPEATVREARLLARVRHPNVVTVHGADRVDGRVGIWMEFVQGETLRQIVSSRGTLDAREAAVIGIDLCRALSAVHAAGITHQDVKPGNIMRAEGGRIVLMDFGLGRDGAPRGQRDMPTLSGTPLFMAPEVLRGRKADSRADVYSLGVVLFSLVTGSLPVEAEDLSKLRAKHENGPVRAARDLRPDLPEAFALVLDRALAGDPGHRFQTPGEVERALLQSLGIVVPSSRGLPARFHGQRAAGFALLGAVVIAGTLGWLAVRSGEEAETPAGPPFLADPTLILLGEHPDAMFGLAVAGVGDVDQDGFDDVLVGAPQESEGAPGGGKIYFYRGGPRGLAPQPDWTAVDSLASARLGWSIASATNLSFDGFSDLVVGAPGADPGGVAVGRVLVYPGSAQGPSPVPSQVLSATEPGTLFGYAIATGDVDHDGDDDLLIGEPGYGSYSGRATLYLATGGTFAETAAWTAEGTPGSHFGAAVDIRGDVNNDGFRDAVIGAPRASLGLDAAECGAAYVYLGSVTGLDSIPTRLSGRQPGALFGRDVVLSGDLDGDGYEDLVVGAEGGTNGEESEGIVEAYFGSSSGIGHYGSVFVESNEMGANLGGHMAPAGDIDGDGYSDVFVGAVRLQKPHPREGAVLLFGGSPGRDLRRLWSRLGGKPGSWYGSAMASGDFNGDGLTDLVVSACAWDSPVGLNVGRVDLFLQHR